jgi:predicted RNase H-like HicB family nuclease
MTITGVAAAGRTYTVVLIPNEDGGYSVEVPALPGCFTHGSTREIALERAAEAIRAHIGGMEIDGEPIPDDITTQPSIESVTVL